MAAPDRTNKKSGWEVIDARILGQILAAQNILFVLPNIKRIAEFYAQSLASIPGISACRVCLGNEYILVGELYNEVCEDCKKFGGSNGDVVTISTSKCKLQDFNDIRVHTLETNQHHFGFFVFRINSLELFEHYQPFISNLANYISLSLDNRFQKNRLEKLTDELELEIRNRTKELREANQSLKEEIGTREKSEVIQKENYSTLHSIIESADALIFSLDHKYCYTSFNSNHAAVMKAIYNAEIQLGKNLLGYMTVIEDREKAKQNLDRALAGESFAEESYSGEELLSRLYFRVSHNPIKDETGNVIGVAVFSQEITDRKQAEETLRRVSEYNRTLIETSPDPLVTIGPDGKITDVNTTTETVTGYPREKLIGTDFSDYFTEPDKARIGYQKVFREGFVKDYPLEIRHIDGHLTSVLYNASVYRDEKGKVVGVFAAAHDITELKRAEMQLDEQTRILQSFFKHTQTCLVFLDKDFNFIRVNDAYAKVCQREASEFPGHNHFEFYPSDELEGKFRKVVETKETFHIAARPFSFPDHPEWGVSYWDLTLVPILDTNDEIDFLIFSLLDVTGRKRAEEAIQRTSAYNRRLIEVSPDPLVTIGPDGKITDVNVATETVTGCTREQLIGTDFSDYFTEPQKARFGYQEVFRKGLVRNYPLELRNKNGEIFHVLYNASIYRNDDGEVAGIFAAARDITIRKRFEEELHQSQRKLSFHLQQTIYGVIEFDTDFKVRYWNPAAENIFGYTQKEVLNRWGPELIIPVNIHPQIDLIWKDLLKQSGGTYNINENVTKDGKTIICEWINTALIDDEEKVTGVMSLVHDITLRKRAEEEIVKLNMELEDRVHQRTIQLEAANKELEAFSYSVSHDLRAPLRGIDGFSQVLLDEYQNNLDEDGKNYLQRIRASAQKMAQLIDDMLSLSRVTRSEMKITSVNLSDIANEIADDLLKHEPDRNVQFVITPGLIANGDARLLRIALENLISNSWKFTSKHQTGKIEFSLKKQNGEKIYYIKDDGAGFNMKYVSKLFGPFQRLHTTSEFPGIGVGLAIVQRVITRHEGKVWAEGEIEQGAVFYFTLNKK